MLYLHLFFDDKAWSRKDSSYLYPFIAQAIFRVSLL